MVEVKGTLLSKEYEDKFSSGNLTEFFYYILTMDSAYGKRAIIVRLHQPFSFKHEPSSSGSTNEEYVAGLEKILKEGDTISFQTANPQQPVHMKRADEIYLYGGERK